MGFIVDIGLPASLASIMLALGLSLKFSDFVRVFRNPREIFVGLFCQVILLPLVALVLVLFWPLAPEISIGLMVIAAAPGGTVSNLFTRLALGDVALSVTLTALSSFLSVFSVPAVVSISLYLLNNGECEFYFSPEELFIQLFSIVILPIALGAFLRKIADGLSTKMAPDLPPAKSLTMM